jgi:hypothetical protein
MSPVGRHFAGGSCFLSSSDRTRTSPTRRRLTGDLTTPWAITDRSNEQLKTARNEVNDDLTTPWAITDRSNEQLRTARMSCSLMFDVEAVRANETSEHTIRNHPASCLTKLSWRRLKCANPATLGHRTLSLQRSGSFYYAQPDHDSDHGGARSSTRRNPSGNRTADKVRGDSRQPRTVRSHRAALGRGQASLLGDDPRVSRRGAFAAPRTGRRSTAPAAHFDEGRCRRSCTTCSGACAVKRALERHGRRTTTCAHRSPVEAALSNRLSVELGHLLLSRQRRSSHGRQRR